MLDKKNIFNINHLILYFLIFNFFFIILRIILPLGDEADYFHRYQFSIFNFENLNYLYRDDYNASISCNKAELVGGIFEPLMKISPFFCTITINEFFERVVFGFLINIVYFFLIFIFYSNQTILNLLNISDKNKNNNLHIFFCSIIYPSVIYFLGSRSNEVFLFYLTIFFFLCWKNIFVSLVIAFLAILIDKGNGYIFLLFLCFFYFFRYLNEFIKLKYIIIINIFLIIILIFF